MKAKLVNTRQFKKRDGTWVKEVTVDAEDKSTGMTAAEIIDILGQIPPNVYPQFYVKIKGEVKQIKYSVSFVQEDI